MTIENDKKNAFELEWASEKNDEETIKSLIDAGVRPSAKALEKACLYAQEPIVKLLLDADAPISDKTVEATMSRGHAGIYKLVSSACIKPY